MRLAPLRLLVGLCLLGGAVAFFFMVWISGWPRVEEGGVAYYLPPGSPDTRVKAEILPLLGKLGGAALGLGAAALIIERLATRRAKRLGDAALRPGPRPSLGRTLGLSVIAAAVGLAGTFGYRWYAYVTNDADPYDEVGITLNANALAPINQWGCARLKETFASRALPPYGCSGADGKWR